MTTTEPSAHPQRHRLIVAAKVAVSALLLGILLSRIDATRLWSTARHASLVWLAVALGVYFVNVLVSTWRWHLLLRAQRVDVSSRLLLGSFLVATFFNNFLPSNIGGDVIRIRDSAKEAGSKTLATTVVLVDRTLGLMGLVLVAAVGASVAAAPGHPQGPILPIWLWTGLLVAAVVSAPAVLAPAGIGRLLQPLTALHPEWIGGRIDTLTTTLARFRERPSALASAFAGALVVQGLLVLFYAAVGVSLGVHVGLSDLAVVVPISLVVQMLPVSVNGFGVREATFSFYFSRIGLPIESALLVSLIAAAVVMVFSLSGAAVYVARRH